MIKKLIKFFRKQLTPKKYEFGMWRVFLKDKGYIPPRHITAEDEIKEFCKENRMAYLSITPRDAYEVFYCEVKTDEEFENLRDLIDKKGMTTPNGEIK